ncbi:MAG: NADH-quinone oxidoreductase subunit H [Deltaproteobacteria bacterium]|nr:NADH-quinone oxidoreductase subunit H [Deltaproteobacteria bacterium]
MEVLISLAKVIFAFVIVLQLTLVLLWVERKGSALIQDRVGANRANLFGGLLPFNLGIVNTWMADPLKLFHKEDIVPADADRFLHWLAPWIAIFPLFVTFTVIPFGDVLIAGGYTINLQGADLNLGILYVLAMLSMAVYGVIVGGWASNSRYAFLGGVRGSAQMVSYEIAMGLSLVSVVLTFGTLDFQEIARAQGDLLFGVFPAWGFFYQPLALLIFFIAGMAESKRAPFDLPEAESELVAGFYTEYSGSKQSVFMMADFVEVAIVAGLVTTLFFGGWQVPWLYRDGFHFPGGFHVFVPSLLVTVLQVLSFLVKLFLFCWLQILIRWSLPRLRYDQLMDLGWKRLLPLSLANVAITAVFVLLFDGKTVW